MLPFLKRKEGIAYDRQYWWEPSRECAGLLQHWGEVCGHQRGL